ncbi:MAG: hypothetical protein ACXWCZ_11795 [Flavisolibacter sp.]
MIQKNWKEDLHRYLTAIAQTNRHKMLQINSIADHLSSISWPSSTSINFRFRPDIEIRK